MKKEAQVIQDKINKGRKDTEEKRTKERNEKLEDVKIGKHVPNYRN